MSTPRILLLHAFPFDSRMWEEVREPVEAAGWTTEAPDFPGEGSIGDWADALLADEGRIVPVGSSLGGYAAFELWRRAPERVAGLVLVGTRAGADPPDVRAARDGTVAFLREEGVQGIWPGLAARLFGPGTPAKVVERAGEIALSQDPERLVGHVLAMRDRADSIPLLPEISVPVLVVAGADDQVVPLGEARVMADAVPDGELARLDGTGHLPPFEWPGELARRLLRFLEDVR